MTFGRAMLDHWLLDPEWAYLNHGTVGAPPRRVLERQQALRDEMERQPSRFMLRELNGSHPMPWRTSTRMREAIAPVAAFLGANSGDLVFVPNVTTGINAVLGSLPLRSGDEVVITDLGYGAVALAAHHYCERGGATLRTVGIEHPIRDADAVIEPIVRALTPHTRLVVVDHVTARTALVLPVAAIAAECRARGVPVLVDGAHAPGSRPIDIPALGVDWYAANLHKWAYAPRACGILWAAPERQSMLRAPVVSWGYDQGFLEEFDHTATSDPTSYLAAPEGIALLQEWGFEACVAYMHGLAWDAAHLLADRWQTSFEIPRAMVGSMATVALPESAGTTVADAERLRLALLVEDRIEVDVHARRDRLWARVSAQVYNDTSDITRLAGAVARHAPVRAQV
ncbi:MAG TPA: aminotransferase class V-fold PLP-dependent enzyme [Vicinamibacterales bacterium]|nr:aminotransferase class V-fold PLP-dependent enzyme [Vicinamibacterales bacterium]